MTDKKLTEPVDNPKRLTDNEIIKALEYWKKFDNEIDQMLSGRFKDDKMLIEQKEIVEITLNLFDLIKRLKDNERKYRAKVQTQRYEISCNQKNIERYKGIIKILEKDIAKAKSEAVKEFATRLKCGVSITSGTIACDDIDNLAKEMVGENND